MLTASQYVDQLPSIVRINFLLEFKRFWKEDFYDNEFSSTKLNSPEDLILGGFDWSMSVLGSVYWSSIYKSLIDYGFVISPIPSYEVSLN